MKFLSRVSLEYGTGSPTFMLCAFKYLYIFRIVPAPRSGAGQLRRGSRGRFRRLKVGRSAYCWVLTQIANDHGCTAHPEPDTP
jgi:hypothetical protein